MLFRPPRPRLPRQPYLTPCRLQFDGYQDDYPVHPSRNQTRQQGQPPDREHSRSYRPQLKDKRLPNPRHQIHLRSSVHPHSQIRHPGSLHIPSRVGMLHRGKPGRLPLHHVPAAPLHRTISYHSRHPRPMHCSKYLEQETDYKYYDTDDHEYPEYQQILTDINHNEEVDDQEYDNNFEITETEGLNFVSKATERPFGGWVNSSSEPVVKNKELDDWVPASEKTRVTTEVLEDAQVTAKSYEIWKEKYGDVKKVSKAGNKRKASKGTFSAAGKHPIGALKEKIPTCEFYEEARERNEDLRFWKLTASVKFTGYMFLGYGVTLKIAKAEAAVKALTFLDVEGLSEMNNHITDTYTSKQQMLEHVLQDERDKKKVEEPWYIKIGDDEENVPVFKPKELPTPDTHPTMFLNQWYGPDIQTEYEIENPGFRPEIFCCTLTVQGQAFQGSGLNKKEAQKLTSVLVLRKLEENPPPINRKGQAAKSKGSKSKKPKITGVADMPSLPGSTQIPTGESKPIYTALNSHNTIPKPITQNTPKPIRKPTSEPNSNAKYNPHSELTANFKPHETYSLTDNINASDTSSVIITSSNTYDEPTIFLPETRKSNSVPEENVASSKIKRNNVNFSGTFNEAATLAALGADELEPPTQTQTTKSNSQKTSLEALSRYQTQHIDYQTQHIDYQTQHIDYQTQHIDYSAIQNIHRHEQGSYQSHHSVYQPLQSYQAEQMNYAAPHTEQQNYQTQPTYSSATSYSESVAPTYKAPEYDTGYSQAYRQAYSDYQYPYSEQYHLLPVTSLPPPPPPPPS